MQNSASPSPVSIRFAHLSDPHLSTLDDVRWRELFNKRLLGYLSWRLRRRREHRIEVLECLGRDVARAAPEHILVTGDLTHVGTPSECRQAAGWLESLGPPHRVSLVPGNHDCYTRAAWAETIGRWEAYMRGDAAGTTAREFPWMRRRGPAAVIGLSTALPTAPFLATGRVGRAQLDRLAQMLDASGAEQLFRIVMLHHPPVDSVAKGRRRLTDAAAFREVLGKHGAELVLHGHAHRWVNSAIATGTTRIPVLGIPSASALTDDPGRRAGYSLIEISRRADGWSVRIARRRLDPGGRSLESAGEETLTPSTGG